MWWLIAYGLIIFIFVAALWSKKELPIGEVLWISVMWPFTVFLGLFDYIDKIRGVYNADDFKGGLR
jgi:hypothetical protein